MNDTPDPNGSIFDGFLGGDDSQWAFGTDFEDPLAGIDAAVPAGVDAHALALYSLMLADDALVLSHRLSEWCSNAPDLEEDIALTNIALDLLGQARFLLARAAAADPSIVPPLPDGSPIPPDDALAFFRDADAYRNVLMAEVPNGDFGHTVARILVFATARLALFERLTGSRDPVLAAVAAKGVKELAYHRDFAGRWFVTLAQGTDESRRRVVAGLGEVWRHHDELLRTHPVERELAEAGVAVEPSATAAEVETVLAQVFAAAGVERPTTPQAGLLGGRSGRDGVHTEALSRMLAEMQVVARAHPLGRW
ncbi:1,2-phenylacetyl-CoA epoxidase subunit PaaC [Thermopolyspora sp. NPDC052614]|uniref:1,2-phenylacetyl-CoA epoxidase subunit PaaC n=1 Tax=Thermopolyspora sp. NPDC052614 TaxID=3155682 RepID=UPI003443379D